MAQDPITLIIRTIGELFTFFVLMRFLLQMAKADYYNPISQAIVKITNPPLMPLQKMMPRAGRFDMSSLLLALIVKGLTLFLLFTVAGVQFNIIQLLIYSVAGLVSAILTIYFWAVLGSVIISWIAPQTYHPAPQLLMQLTEPLFALCRKVIPPIGGLDLSPIAIFLIIQLLQSQLRAFVI